MASNFDSKSGDNYRSNDGKSFKTEEMSEGEIEDSEPEETEKLYCICRTADTNRFMIGCDKCEEWFHGNCISITQEYAKRIQHFYCLLCREKDPSLEIVFKESKKQKRQKTESESGYAQSFRQFLNNQNQNSDQNKNNSVNKDLEGVPNRYERDPDYNPIEKKTIKKYFESDEEEDEDYYEESIDGRKRHRETTNKTKRGRPVRREKEEKKEKRGRRPYKSSTVRSRHRRHPETNKKTHKKNKEHIVEVDTGPKQCYGPGCINSSRKGSKYCSDECGVKLASNRIYEILPHRIRQWQSTPCDADERSHKSLEAIRTEQQEARRILSELDQRQKDLEIIINKGKNTPPMTEEESNEAENEAETELSIYCVTCGHEINQKLVIIAFYLSFECFINYILIEITTIGTQFEAKNYCESNRFDQLFYSKPLNNYLKILFQ